MKPLTLDDLIPFDEYCAARVAHVAAAARYLDRYRRVRIGPRITLVFENRQTLWFHIHELLRVARLREPVRIQAELDWYNQLLPGRGRLQAALQIDVPATQNNEAAFWNDLPDSTLKLQIGSLARTGQFLTCRAEDRCFATAHWLEFTFGADERAALADRRKPALFAIEYRDYCHQSGLLTETVRQSLLDDLARSDRDAA